MIATLYYVSSPHSSKIIPCIVLPSIIFFYCTSTLYGYFSNLGKSNEHTASNKEVYKKSNVQKIFAFATLLEKIAKLSLLTDQELS